ncbi:MAG TPA: hypothetical protein VNO18_04090 [Xanthobacteraceae bacterium]|jgi:hypothetical protein|nr:hypothetical protein [Xanthobacteraceae bacterium]
MEAIAIWLAGTTASDMIQKTLWFIPVMQAIHILSVATAFSSVVMAAHRLGASASFARSGSPIINVNSGFVGGSSRDQ